MSRKAFMDVKIKTRPRMDMETSNGVHEFLGIHHPETVSEFEMIGQPVFYQKKLVGTIMDQWDGHSLVDVNHDALFIIDDYKNGLILGKDIRVHLRG
jgi:hypothetical protein